LISLQAVREVADGVLSLRSQTPISIHAEGEEENVAVLALLLVVRSLDSIGIIDDLVDALAPVGGAADTGDEDVDGKCSPVVVSCDVSRPLVGD